MYQKEKYYYVYMLASQRNGTLYTGFTNNVFNRNLIHKLKINPDSFSARYNVDRLVYYETFTDVNAALLREKRLKKWRRRWKIELIEKDNPTWRDIFKDY